MCSFELILTCPISLKKTSILSEVKALTRCLHLALVKLTIGITYRRSKLRPRQNKSTHFGAFSPVSVKSQIQRFISGILPTFFVLKRHI